MKTVEKFLQEKSFDFPEVLHNVFVKKWLKEYALEIANKAFDAGFAYAVASHSSMKQNQLSKAEYSQKLHNEL